MKARRRTSSAIRNALAGIRKARSVDEGDHYMGLLARAARANLGEALDIYARGGRDARSLGWALQGLTNPRVIDLHKRAFKSREHTTRWAALEGLKHSSDAALVPLFIGALKDRAHLVKAVAVEWLAKHGNADAIGPLEHMVRLPSMIRHSPGTVADAEKVIVALRARRAVTPRKRG